MFCAHCSGEISEINEQWTCQKDGYACSHECAVKYWNSEKGRSQIMEIYSLLHNRTRKQQTL